MKQTAKNLAAAFVGESQARNRYTMYAKVAEKEGYPGLADIFRQTSDHEHIHAKSLYKMLIALKADGEQIPDTITIEAEVPLAFGTTAENLRASIRGEHYENATMYPAFAETALNDGFTGIAARFRAIGQSERFHEERYAAILKDIEDGTLLKGKGKWLCKRCGYVHDGSEPPEKCPSCEHPKQYFERLP